MEPDWSTQAGAALDKLARAISDRGLAPKKPIVVFGSGPLQILIDQNLLSGDLDISVPENAEQITALIEEIGFGKGKARYYIEVVPSYVFRPGINWLGRVSRVERHGVEFLIPDPLDILLAKLRRLEEKDIRAFLAVIAKTGRPTETELIAELRDVYDPFYFQKNGEKSALWENTERLWPILFQKAINVREDILRPVLEELAASSDQEYIGLLRDRLGL